MSRVVLKRAGEDMYAVARKFHSQFMRSGSTCARNRTAQVSKHATLSSLFIRSVKSVSDQLSGQFQAGGMDKGRLGSKGKLREAPPVAATSPLHQNKRRVGHELATNNPFYHHHHPVPAPSRFPAQATHKGRVFESYNLIRVQRGIQQEIMSLAEESGARKARLLALRQRKLGQNEEQTG